MLGPALRLFFFFQAEDGIRDKLVTGVQTCALPIYVVERHVLRLGRVDRRAEPGVAVGVAAALLGGDGDFARSEEHTSELQSLAYLVCRLLLEKKKKLLSSETRTSPTVACHLSCVTPG